MKEAIANLSSSDDEENGYESDIDQDQTLIKFKTNFKTRLTAAAKTRKSHQDIAKQFRRIDSLARLLEGNSICAAVYYHQPTNTIWLANNKIHENSRDNNDHINNMKAIFNLVSEEHLSIDDIMEKLAKVIKLNFTQEKRYEISKLESAGIDIDNYIKEMLADMFQCNLTTKQWKEEVIKNLDCDESTKYAHKELLKKISKITRDFLKLRDFLLNENTQNAVSKGLLSAIRQKKFKILHTENKDVHAEMRILAKTFTADPNSKPYIGISKLCCDHCSLAMSSFGANSRGVHGQSTKWPVPSFVTGNDMNLKKFLGAAGHGLFSQLSKENKKEALAFVASKDGNPIKEDARHGRHMNADSSDSDVAFGPNLSDEEQIEDANELPLAEVWQLRYITTHYEAEFARLLRVGLNITEIVELYKKDSDKFENLSSEACIDLIEEDVERRSDGDAREVFDKLSDIYDEDTDLFSEIVSDENQSVVEYGIDEVCDRYNAIATNQPHYDSDGEEINYYSLVIHKLKKENSYDYGRYSDDSQDSCDSEESEGPLDAASGDDASCTDSEHSSNNSGSSSEADESDSELPERFGSMRMR